MLCMTSSCSSRSGGGGGGGLVIVIVQVVFSKSRHQMISTTKLNIYSVLPHCSHLVPVITDAPLRLPVSLSSILCGFKHNYNHLLHYNYPGYQLTIGKGYSEQVLVGNLGIHCNNRTPKMFYTTDDNDRRCDQTRCSLDCEVECVCVHPHCLTLNGFIQCRFWCADNNKQLMLQII